MSEVIRHLCRTVLLRDGAGRTDGQLLEDYLSGRDEAALAALVRRHGPMVWGTCRRVLFSPQDAEDAFQATFLVLVRRAAAIVPREKVANWLYGVAHQTALKARATAAKRRARERQTKEMPETARAEQERWPDLQPLLDEELNRLPDKYRVVIVLCDLEGKTRKEAARQLGCPEGTVAGRLARARTMLAKRLARHGLLLSGGSLAVVLSQHVASAGVPTSVVSNTIKVASLSAAGQAAPGLISAKVAALTEGVLKAVLLTKLKAAAVVLVMLGLVAVTCGMLAIAQTDARGDGVEKPAAKADDKPKDAGDDKANPLTVTIKLQKIRIRANEPFQVDLRVVNSSPSTQSFRVMTCSWDDHWKSSNERVSWEGWDCFKNVQVTVKLEPGEAYEKTLAMLLHAGKPPETVSFMMGFTPLGSQQTYWSNEVTLQVDGVEKPAAKADDKPKDAADDKDNAPTKVPKKPEGGQEVKGLVALAEVVEKPGQGLFEVRLSLKNVSDQAITICHCPYSPSQVQVQWLGPDGKLRTSQHHNYPPSNFLLTKDYFVNIGPGEVRPIVPTIRFHTSPEKPGTVDASVQKTLGFWEAVDSFAIQDRSNLAQAGEHRVTVSFTNDIVGYPDGPGPPGGTKRIAVDHIWTGTVTAKEVTFQVK